MARTALPDNARRYRQLMWLTTAVGIVALVVAFQGGRGVLPQAVGVSAAAVFFVAITLAAWLGLRMHRQALADREMQARRAMIVMLAAKLGEQDDESLQRIVEQGGMPGEAAAMILRNRQGNPEAPPPTV